MPRCHRVAEISNGRAIPADPMLCFRSFSCRNRRIRLCDYSQRPWYTGDQGKSASPAGCLHASSPGRAMPRSSRDGDAGPHAVAEIALTGSGAVASHRPVDDARQDPVTDRVPITRPNVLAWCAATEVSRHPGLRPVRILEKGRFKLIRPPPRGYITRFVGIGWEKRPAGGDLVSGGTGCRGEREGAAPFTGAAPCCCSLASSYACFDRPNWPGLVRAVGLARPGGPWRPGRR